MFVRRRYLLTSVKRPLLLVSVPVFQNQSLKIVCTVGSCCKNTSHIIVCELI